MLLPSPSAAAAASCTPDRTRKSRPLSRRPGSSRFRCARGASRSRRALPARARAAAAARADAVLDWGVKLGKAEVAEGGSEGGSGAATSTPTPTAGFRRVDLSREQPPEVAKALVLRATASLGNKGTPVEAVVPLGRDTPQASAALALEALARLGFATLTARLVPLGATGGVAVVVDVALTEAAFAPPARAGKGRRPRRQPLVLGGTASRPTLHPHTPPPATRPPWPPHCTPCSPWATACAWGRTRTRACT